MSTFFEAPQIPEQPNPLQTPETTESSRFREVIASTKRLAGRVALVLGLAAGPSVAVLGGEATLAPDSAESCHDICKYLPGLGSNGTQH